MVNDFLVQPLFFIFIGISTEIPLLNYSYYYLPLNTNKLNQF